MTLSWPRHQALRQRLGSLPEAAWPPRQLLRPVRPQYHQLPSSGPEKHTAERIRAIGKCKPAGGATTTPWAGNARFGLCCAGLYGNLRRRNCGCFIGMLGRSPVYATTRLEYTLFKRGKLSASIGLAALHKCNLRVQSCPAHRSAHVGAGVEASSRGR